jgi:hypothetical protein
MMILFLVLSINDLYLHGKKEKVVYWPFQPMFSARDHIRYLMIAHFSQKVCEPVHISKEFLIFLSTDFADDSDDNEFGKAHPLAQENPRLKGLC